MTTREEFLALRPPEEEVEIPDRDLKFRVRGLTAGERDDYEQSLVEIDRKTGQTRVKQNNPNVRASLLVRTLVDDTGARLFQDHEVVKVSSVDAAVVDVLWKAARRLSGMRIVEEEEDEGSTFDSAQDGASGSG